MQIRSVRTAAVATLDLAAADPHELAQLQALDRYERHAHTKRRRALKKLAQLFVKTNPMDFKTNPIRY